MIVPTTRLLLAVALTLLPAALAIATAPSLLFAAVAVVIAAFLVTLLDALIARRKVAVIDIELPALVRLVKDRAAEFDVRLHREGSQPRQVRIGLVTDPALHAQEEVVTRLAADAGAFRLTWSACPSERGSYAIRRAVVETSSGLGLWSVRDQRDVSSEIRVYPNLLSDKQSAASLLLNRGPVGAHVQQQVGKGREFEKLREYIPGDTYDEISWTATARHGRPVTKVYQVERTQEVYAVIDCSRLSGRRVNDEPVLERFLISALLLGLGVEKEGDLFGVVAFDNRVQKIVRAAAGRSHFGVCRDAIYALKPQRVSPDFRELSRFLRTSFRKRCLLVFLTDLDDAVIAEDFERNIGALRRNHIVLANMVAPAGVEPIFSHDNVATADDVIDRLGGHLRWHKLHETQRRLHTQGVPFTMLKEDRFATEVVSQYRNVKARQLL